MNTNFSDRLVERCRQTNSHLAVSLVPAGEKMPDFLRERFESPGAAIYAFNKGIIDAIFDAVPAVVLPVPLYEAYGIGGLVAMDASARYAASRGMTVILDGAFGGSREAVEASLEAYLSTEPENGAPSAGSGRFFADAVTVSPYSDSEAVKAAAAFCMEHGKGIFLNVRSTTSYDAVHFENIKVHDTEEPLYKSVADDANEFGRNYIGENGFSVIGMAVYPGREAQELRRINRCGIALVHAESCRDFEKEELYPYFYEDDGEGALILVRDAVLFAGRENPAEYEEEEFAAAAGNAAKRISGVIENRK